MKKTLKILLVALFTILVFLNTNVQSNAYAQSYTPIMGQSQATKAQAFQLLRNNNSAKTDAYIQDFVDITWEEAVIEGVRADVAFSLMMLETGWLKFGGDVKEEQNNFGGIGATGGGNPGHEFPDMRTGIRAVVQHLKAYASSDPLRSECVDPRFKYVTRASAVNIEWLGIRENPEGFGWATGDCYGYKIINITRIMQGLNPLTFVGNLSIKHNNQTVTTYYTNRAHLITANAISANKPLYRFWIGYYSNGKWSWNMLQDYSTNNKISWTPTKPGLYEVNVHVRDSSSTKAYETVKFYDINVKASPTKIQSLDIGGTTFYVGKSYTATAKATSANKPMYRFWLGYYSNGKWSWNMLQDYSTNNKISWTPTKPGLYEVNVHVRDSSSTKAYETVKFFDINVKTSPPTKIQSLDIGGTTFYTGKNYTATAKATSANKPMYRFWLGYYSNGKWSWNMLQDYSTNNKISWTPTKPGLYEVNVHVKDSSSTKAYEAVKFFDINIINYPTKIQSFDIGGTTFFAGESYIATAKATSANKPMYRFWLGYYSNGKWSWNMLQDYSTNNKITWTPTKPGLYEVNVHVKDSISKKAYEAVKYYDITVKTTVAYGKTIVLDAGHGGIDPGAISSDATGKLKESDLNEQQTRILGDLLKAYGVNVIYTRDKISPRQSYTKEAEIQDLKNRAAVANNENANLFLSIHHNASNIASAKGVETYYSTNKQPSEAATISKILAENLVNNIASLGFVNRTAKDSEFIVTKNTKMPAVLIEAGFMTNDNEVLRVADKKMQQAIAQKIVDAIIDFYSNG